MKPREINKYLWTHPDLFGKCWHDLIQVNERASKYDTTRHTKNDYCRKCGEKNPDVNPNFFSWHYFGVLREKLIEKNLWEEFLEDFFIQYPYSDRWFQNAIRDIMDINIFPVKLANFLVERDKQKRFKIISKLVAAAKKLKW